MAKDPICGMYVDESKAKASGKTSTYGDMTYYFCSDGCKQQFDKNPASYAGKADPRNGLRGKHSIVNSSSLKKAVLHKDPICGMDVDEQAAKASGRTSKYRGKTYYFCADGCKQEFEKESERYIEEKSGKARKAERPATPAPIHD